MHHLRQAPGSEGCQDHDAHQVDRIRSEERSESTRLTHGYRNIAFQLREFCQRIHKSALTAEYRADDGNDTADHDDALNKVIDCSSHVSAQDDIDCRQCCHHDDTGCIRNVKSHPEQSGKTVVKRRRIRDQENENDRRSRDPQGVALKPLSEEIGHGGGFQVMGHDTGPSSKDDPCHQTSNHSVADPDPSRGDSVFPAKLSGIADKYDRRKV